MQESKLEFTKFVSLKKMQKIYQVYPFSINWKYCIIFLIVHIHTWAQLFKTNNVIS